jgi:hypothetical protein
MSMHALLFCFSFFNPQWEETIDRLSHGPPMAPDVSDMSPRSPREILRGIDRSERSRSASSESEVYGSDSYTPVWQRRKYFERRYLAFSQLPE